jgi:FdhD protein
MSSAIRPSVKQSPILRFKNGHQTEEMDLLVVEEPLEIRLVHGPGHERKEQAISVTMRTPGQDHELALGFLYTEGILKHPNEVASIRHCLQVPPEAEGNVLRVELQPGVQLDLDRLKRNFYTASSCGVCGKSSLEAVEAQGCGMIPMEPLSVRSSILCLLPTLCVPDQVVFRHTGGLHGASLLDANGKVLFSREDVGRHNAVDKVAGAMLNDQSQDAAMMFLSGRAGFELVQKAAMMKVGLVASVGAPSSLAVETAERFGITLVGFLREQRFNVYTYPERILFDEVQTQP